jgi:hypothetical protein
MEKDRTGRERLLESEGNIGKGMDVDRTGRERVLESVKIQGREWR